MESAPAPVLNKRRFWLCLVLVFFCGILCGSILTIGSLRYIRSHFGPPIERVSRKITARIAKDFSLNETARNTVEREVIMLGMEISDQMAETRKSIDTSIDRRKESIGALMPDSERRERWMQEYRSYFPQLPRIPVRNKSDR